MTITIKSPAEQDAMRAAGRAAASVLEYVAQYVKPGVTTGAINDHAHLYVKDVLGCIPAPLGYGGTADRPAFPKSLCTSVNHVVCHGIPGDKPLKKGDIVNVDVTVIKDGFHGDTSYMFMVGEPGVLAKRLVKTAQEAMWAGIRVVKPGTRLGDIGHAVQQVIERAGYSVVRDYCGHGIGRIFHEDPQILHYGKPGTGLELKEGMTFTIEPMVNAGRHETRLLPDAWTVVTKDHSLSAQWEHTVLVTREGVEVLTLRSDENPQ
ncbi:MAG: type I methionyl aminopeptidase [Pseudomonadota bacterium]